MSIIRVREHSFDNHIPVAIIGGGACGMTAALAAREGGAECLVLEQDNTPAGSTGMSYGAICAAGSRLQAAAGIDDTAQALCEDILAITRGKTDPELANLLAQASGPAVDWLVGQHQIELTIEPAWTGLGHRQPRLHAPRNRSGTALMAMLNAACERAGALIATQARVRGLYADAEDRVLGVQVERPDGSLEEIGTDAVVLATCGFAGNPDMVARYLPEVATARYFGHEGNRGDGIAWGQALGGAVADMGSYQALGSLADPQNVVIPHTLLIAGGIQVNLEGERFQDELTDISGQALTILAQPEGKCWMIYDERGHEDALSRFEDYQLAFSLGTPRVADSTVELARLTGLSARQLSATLDAVSAYCQGTKTDPFGREFGRSNQLQPPYYAIRATGALFHTQGGLCIDRHAAVVREDGTALPNLFAGGGAARSVSGPGCWGYLPGIGLCTAVVLGRLAGTHAARVVRRAKSSMP
jgi:fumarate reductase flavoprotein subunit